MYEEVSELKQAIEAGTRADVLDELGNVGVTWLAQCEIQDADPVYVLTRAFEKINNRKGRTVDGFFVKEKEDEKE